MKKAMTILLTFIMVLQLIPIPAFATEEIATAEDLKAFLENPENVTVAEGSTLTVQISAENKFTSTAGGNLQIPRRERTGRRGYWNIDHLSGTSGCPECDPGWVCRL